MKRIAFDIACNYYKDQSAGWIDRPGQAREYYREKPPKFHAATALDATTQQSTDFVDPRQLLDCLLGGDEIITFNGRIYDLILLENIAGPDAVRALWMKPHHDLAGWHYYWKLKDAIRFELGDDAAASYDPVKEARLNEIRGSYDEFIADQLSGTYRDAKFTLDLFERYRLSGKISQTFHDIEPAGA